MMRSAASESSQSQPSPAAGVNLGGLDVDEVLRRKVSIRSVVSKLKKTVLQNELESKGQDTTGSRDLLVERAMEMRFANQTSAPTENVDQEAVSVSSLNDKEPGTSKDLSKFSELTLLFNMMQKQQLAAERRFQLQLEEIRCRSQEKTACILPNFLLIPNCKPDKREVLVAARHLRLSVASSVGLTKKAEI